MKFVALVSGGKDSCFNILHCLAQGHEFIALANLHPEDTSKQELDSFMFQTVGHDVLDYYSECCEVPMYRQAIVGKSKNQSLEYDTTLDDEIEDLYQLLIKVQENHPDVEAVSVGAILSSYQRTRVEHVCQRLGLVSLAYLWQRDQLELMTEMCESGLDARLIKVAAIGLDERHLTKSLQEMLPKLVQLNSMYDVHICGEGGEFETIVLDAPFFKRHKLQIKDTEIVRDSGDVYYLKLQIEMVPKLYEEVKDWSKFVVVPPLLNDDFEEIYEELGDDFAVESLSVTKTYDSFWKQHVKTVGNKVFISNIVSDKSTIEDQVIDVFDKLSQLLKSLNLSFTNIQCSQLLVASMAQFGVINSLYQKYFTKSLPPSRICVETVLPQGTHLQLSVTVLTNLSDKKGLHVQGRSYWASSNIGPYSQLIIDTLNGIATISGQIPLIPASMELCQSPQLSTVLSLQHYHVVKQLIGVTETFATVAFTTSETYVPSVVKTWGHYEPNYTELLIIVQVTNLPRGSGVEWGGLSIKPPSVSQHDEDDIVDNMKELNLRGLQTVSFFNRTDLDQLNKLARNSEYHYTIYAQPDTDDSALIGFVNTVSCEFVPVVSVWDSHGIPFGYAVISRALI